MTRLIERLRSHYRSWLRRPFRPTIFLGEPVHYQQVEIQPGHIIELATVAGGAVPAETRGYRMIAAGLSLCAARPNNPAAFALVFTFQSKWSLALDRVLIEAVSPQLHQSTLVLDDIDPKLSSGQWHGALAKLPLTSPEAEWVHAEEETRFVFRITIVPVGRPAHELYQLAVFPPEMKRRLLASVLDQDPGKPEESPSLH